MSRHVLNLNFHGVGPVPREMSAGELDCWIEYDRFEQVLDAVRGHPHVRLSFDDGNASDVDVVLPALLERGMTASFFVCSGRLGVPTFLSRDQVRLLRVKGMRIGNHGVAHRSWRTLNSLELKAELNSSRVALEETCGTPVCEAACPFGEYDASVLCELQKAGYEHVYTSDGGFAPANSWLQTRHAVMRSMPLEGIDGLIRNQPGIWRRAELRARQFLKGIR